MMYATGAVFSEFDDETVEIVVNSAAFQVFGVDAETLFTINVDGEVMCTNFLENTFVKANQNISEFFQSYCTFMSGIYLARDRIIPLGVDDERLLRCSRKRFPKYKAPAGRCQR
jgi:hypothetical protein